MDSKLKRVQDLVYLLNYHSKLYDDGKPLIRDAEWDKLYFELQELEKETGLILNSSPTQTIIYEIKNELNKVEHSHKMLSLEKTKSVKEVSNFIGNQMFLSMCKMDGLTCSLTYKDGQLVSAETRGNGIIGEDILHNAKVLPSIPKQIPYLDELVIDGEIICTYKNFEEFSDVYKNPRNFAAGSIRLLDAEECASRKLTFVAWDVLTSLYDENGVEYRLDQKLKTMAMYGFTIVPYSCMSGAMCTESGYETLIEEAKNAAELYHYPIDGIVFKFADCEYGRSLGETSHHFNNALAYKFTDEVYETELLNIEWMMGRSGILTPVAIFKPIDMDGTTVERASMHNISVMEDLLGRSYYGQKIWVSKRNMIIPQIENAEKWDNPM